MPNTLKIPAGAIAIILYNTWGKLPAKSVSAFGLLGEEPGSGLLLRAAKWDALISSTPV